MATLVATYVLRSYGKFEIGVAHQCYKFLSVVIGNSTYKSVLNFGINIFYTILDFSLRNCGLQ